MRISLLALTLTAAASPAFSDASSDFDQLMQTFPTLSFQIDPEVQVVKAKEFVAGLSGKWVQIGPLVADTGSFPDPETFAKACEKVAYTVAPVGDFSFDLTMPAKIMPFVVHLQWAGGTSFAARYDEASFLARMFGDQLDAVQPGMLFSTLVLTTWLDTITLIPAGQDLILMQSPRRPADGLARCP